MRDTAGNFHKLKVAKWFAKPGGGGGGGGAVTKSVARPLYKDNIFGEKGTSFEEFENKCQSSSIKCFRGVIESYVLNNDGVGHNGFIEISLIKQNRKVKERVLFHSGSVWLCTRHFSCSGTGECIRKCGTDDAIAEKAKIGTEVIFTARKIPAGFLDSCRFQAKSVWQGEASIPNYVIPPSNSKLDEYLEDYFDVTNCLQPSSSPTTTALKASEAENPVPSSGSVRQKPLKGSLNQLNPVSNQSAASLKVQKKVAPSNFAQAVAPVKASLDDSQITDKATVESLPNIDEIVVSVPGKGRFILDKGHFQGPFVDIRSRVKPGSSLNLTLKEAGERNGRYTVLGAFLDSVPANQSTSRSPVEQLPTFSSAESVQSKAESHLEINLEDLDKYYDTFPEISAYLHREILYVLPDLGLASEAVEHLANEIIFSGGDEKIEISILERFFRTHNVASSVKSKFIGEYLKFRHSQQHLEEQEQSNGDLEKSEKPEIDGLVVRFLHWVETKNNQKDVSKLPSYKKFFSIPSVAALWVNYVGCAEEMDFSSLLDKQSVDEAEIVQLRAQIEKSTDLAWSVFQGWIEKDTNLFKLNLLNNPDIRGTNSEPPIKVPRFAGLELSQEEWTFVRKKEADRETQPFILRILLLLRKNRVSFEVLENLHREHLSMSSKKRNREFNLKLHSLLMRNTSQGMLEEANMFIKNCKELRAQEHIPISCRKIEKYIPILTSSLCGFLFDKQNELNKSPAGKINIDNTKTICPEEDFALLIRFMERNGNQAQAEAMIQTLLDRSITMSRLNSLFDNCREHGVMRWNLELSKLSLNPPAGISVPEVGTLLWSFFSNSGSAESIPEEEKQDARTGIESIYELQEVTSALKSCEAKDLESALLEGLEVLWPVFAEDQDFYKLYHMIAPLSTVIWRKCNVDKDFFEEGISSLYGQHDFGIDCVQPLKDLVSSWAVILEKSRTFETASLNALCLLKLALASFDPNIYEEIQDRSMPIFELVFRDLVHGKHLLAAEGVVTGKLGSFTLIQTKYCTVLADPLVFAPDSTSSTMVLVDSFSVLADDDDNELFYLATAVWSNEPSEDSGGGGASMGEPPFTGVLRSLTTAAYQKMAAKAKDAVTKSAKQLSDFDRGRHGSLFFSLYWECVRSDFPEWADDLEDAKKFYVLHTGGFVDRENFERVFRAQMEKYIHAPVLAHGEFYDALEEYIVRLEDTNKMKIYLGFVCEEHDTRSAIEKFCEKFPCGWYKTRQYQEESQALSPSQLARGDNPDKLTDSTQTSIDDKDDISLRTAALAELRRETDEKIEWLSNAVGTLFQLVQESNVTISNLDKRIQSLEKVKNEMKLSE